MNTTTITTITTIITITTITTIITDSIIDVIVTTSGPAKTYEKRAPAKDLLLRETIYV